MLCSECQPECENDIHVPMDILQLKERLKKKKKKIIRLTEREIMWTGNIQESQGLKEKNVHYFFVYQIYNVTWSLWGSIMP